MTLDELRALAASVGFPDPETAAAVAMAESRGNPSAQNIVTNPAPGNGPERSFGLWQVNTLAHPNYDEQSLLDPTYNARAALAISSGGTNWTPWSTYNHGDYKQYMVSYASTIRFTPAVTTAIAFGILGTAAVAAYLLEPEVFGLPGFAGARENPSRELAERPSMRVQSLLFPRDRWTKPKARAWLKEHGYKSRKVDETDRYYRFRQEDPDQFTVLRTKDFGENIKAIVGR
jgi:hypothetical protein